MIMARALRRAALAAVAVMAMTGLQAAPASAQLFWDWGGGSSVDSSGREVVRFSPQFTKGQIIVSPGWYAEHEADVQNKFLDLIAT